MSDTDFQHRPVLFDEAIAALAIKPAGVYVDGTFGRGGHSGAIMQQLSDKGRLLALDQDPEAVEAGRQMFADDPRFDMVQCNFESLADVVADKGLAGKVDGVLLDIGVSSPQLDDASRGFSFMRPGPLDMRMNPQAGESAADWLARVSEYDLTSVLMHLGEEKFARRIASAIVKARQERPITDTGQLAKIIEEAVPVRDRHKHPATKSFQAIRIHINRELEVLKAGLQAAVDVLAIGGRLAVISFHSLEDRIVKRFMRDLAKGPQLPKDLPIMDADIKQPFKLVGKAIKPSKAELAENPRARSSVLRVLERIS